MCALIESFYCLIEKTFSREALLDNINLSVPSPSGAYINKICVMNITCDGLVSRPGGVALLLETTCCRNKYQLLWYAPLNSRAGFTFIHF